MYEALIERINGEMHTQMKQEEERITCIVSQEIGYKINTEELIKALQYDRNQYEKGLNEAWEAAVKIYKASAGDLIKIFGGVGNWVKYSAEEAIAKLQEYEKKQKQCNDCMYYAPNINANSTCLNGESVMYGEDCKCFDLRKDKR